MKVSDFYQEAIKQNHYSLKLLIEFLVFEKKVLGMNDPKEKLTYYTQDRFLKKMNEYLNKYERSKHHGERH
jgi:hypothetical protein